MPDTWLLGDYLNLKVSLYHRWVDFFNPPIAFLLAMTLHAQDVGDGDAKSKPINLWMIYRLVNKHSYGKWPFIADLPIKECVFP